MRTRSQIAFALALATLSLWLIWLLWDGSAQEPVYRGKTLSQWLEGCDKSRWVGTEWQDSTEAVRQIGTNAIPALLSKLRQKDSVSVLKLRSWDARQHYVKVKLSYVSAAAQNHKAAVGFEALWNFPTHGWAFWSTTTGD